MDGTRFMRRLDSPSETKRQQLISHVGDSQATIIRQVIIQATPEDIPRSWHMRTAEHSIPSVRPQTMNDRELT
jgi:hypothetical protein